MRALLIEDDSAVANSIELMLKSLTHEGFDARDQFVLVKRFRHVVVGPETEAFYLVFDIVEAREDQDRRLP